MARRKLHQTRVGSRCVVRILRDRDYDEYIVQTAIDGRIVGGAEGGDYFTNDKQDARDTAAHTVKALRRAGRCQR